MTVITCIDDLKCLYKRRVPKMFYDYCESGSWTEETFRRNSSDFTEIGFRQRVAVDLSDRTTASKMMGQDVAMPVALAPVGMTGMQSADGEIKAARAAEKFGVPYTLSTMSICSIEDVAENTSAPFWFQLYVMRDKEFTRNIIQRAKDAGCSALVLTLDLQMLGQRHKDLKNGLSAPPRLTLPNMINMATTPKWCLQMLGTKRHTFRNIVGHAKGVDSLSSLMDWTNDQFDLHLDWRKVEEIKEMWGGPLILKGINDAEDATMAAKVGADAIIVSNHGGRQLDGASSSIRSLPAIVDAVGDKIDVYLDSGIRSGQDVLKALALGAKGTFIGRAYIYGLGAMGEQGVTRALEIIHMELDRSAAFCGHRTLDDIDRDILLLPEGFGVEWPGRGA